METFLMIFGIVEPFIAKLVESVVVPILKRKGYEVFNKSAQNMIADLIKLKTKVTSETNPIKKEAYSEGLALGSATLRAVGNMLIQASDELDK